MGWPLCSHTAHLGRCSLGKGRVSARLGRAGEIVARSVGPYPLTPLFYWSGEEEEEGKCWLRSLRCLLMSA